MQQQRQSPGVTGAYVIVTCLFFAWGFITSLVDPLVAAVKGVFHLSDVEAQLSAFAFFIAYGVMSLPGAVILARAMDNAELSQEFLAATRQELTPRPDEENR